MMLLLLILVTSPLLSNSLTLNPSENIPFIGYNPKSLFDKFPDYGKTWMFFPDGNGVPQVVQLSIPDILPKAHTTNTIEFHLYTRLNPTESQLLQPDNEESIINSNFNASQQTKFIVHGWRSSSKDPNGQLIKDNYLEDGDYNVIVVNWESIASNIVYPMAAADTKIVGTHVGSMIDTLIENNANLMDMHLIGHSLGAHVVGNAGQAVKSGRVKRVTGLDPALPGFEILSPNSRALDPSDAEFVDVIHTCGGVLGYYSALGHADFYPNGGVPSQPGCFGVAQIIEGCSHTRAWQYFSESIKTKNGFMAVECEDFDHFKSGDCLKNQKIPMGDAATYKAKGVYYLLTDDRAPYARHYNFSNTNGGSIIDKSLGLLSPFNFLG